MSKKLIATLLTAALVVANCVPALAAGANDVTGEGAVEYDNSSAVEYDSIVVPVVLDANNYEFELDPSHLLSKFNSVKYDKNDTVYFSATTAAERATVKKKDTSTVNTVFKKDKVELKQVGQTDAADWDYEAGKWAGVVKTVTNKAIVALEEGPFYVWIPDTSNESATAPEKYSNGLPGTTLELDATNINNWFELEDPEDAENKNIKLKVGYRIKGGVDGKGQFEACDGKIYTEDYVDLETTEIVDSDTDALSNYVTKNAETGALTFVNLYTDDQGTLATDADFEYVDATVKSQGRTNEVTLTNKSTKKKTITAEVKMNNVDSLLFAGKDDFSDLTDASSTALYVAATNGKAADTAVLTKADGATEAKATYSVDVDPVSVKDVTYQTTGTTAAGGHNYDRYEGFGVEYSSDSFYIVAKANADTTSIANWNSWAASIDGTTILRPEINIVYTVEDYEEPASTFKVTFMNGDTKFDEQDVESGSTASAPDPAPTSDTKNFGGWYEKEDGEFKDEAFDFSTQITEAVTLYAKWNDPEDGYANYYNNSYWIGTSASAGFETGKTPSKVTIGGKDLTAKVTMTTYDGSDWIVVKWSDCEAAGLTYQAGVQFDIVYVVDGVVYATKY